MKRKRGRGALSNIPVYVPTDSSKHGILPGSAIVGEWEFSVGRVTLDFEGNRFGASNLNRFVERCLAAWGRHVEHYPTVARAYVNSHEVIQVGEFDPYEKKVVVPELDEPKLMAWLGYSPDEWARVRDQELVL